MTKTTKGAPSQQGPEPQGTAEPNEQKVPVEQEGGGERTRSRLTFRPRVDIYETESGLMLLADVPGAKSEGLTIMLERRVLSIRVRWRSTRRLVTVRSTRSIKSATSNASSRSPATSIQTGLRRA
jgi:HSP20 family molecular chaperone IbpA